MEPSKVGAQHGQLRRRKKNPGSALLGNNIYAVKGSKNRKPSKQQRLILAVAQTAASKKEMEQGKKMAKIESYAKEHKITISQAIIHFMD